MFNQIFKRHLINKNNNHLISKYLKSIANENNIYFKYKSNAFSTESNNYFITTPIFYVNSVPHIGHLYSTLIADAFHRFNQMLGKNNTIFSTGTDEHGIKIQREAEMQGIEPKLFCDTISVEFKKLFDSSNISFTHFIRTTDESHKNSVKAFWNCLMSKAFIYKSTYEGWYSTSDETFVSESLIAFNEKNIRVSTESGNAVEWSKEENYIFKLSSFQRPLLDWLNSGDIVKPSVFADILRRDIEKGLRDLSVSRPKSRLSWGIAVPNDETQTIYVWFDALVNYLTVSGYPNCNVWPPDCQVIGKDILKFHGIYWPALLMAAGLEPPRTLLCHSHWLKDDFKMSKSRGNVVDPFHALNTYSCDGFRYFLLREGTPHSDSNYNEEKVKNYLNAELADTLGNLLSRSTSKAINKEQVFPHLTLNEIKTVENEATQLIKTVNGLADECKYHYLNGDFYLGINAIMNCLHLTNLFFSEAQPWLLVKQNSQQFKLQAILFIVLEVLRVCGILLQPIIPDIASHVLNKLNINSNERNWINAKHAFNNESFVSDSIKFNYLSSDKSVIFSKVGNK